MMRKSRPWSRPIDQMDVWLESQGFYRKHTARDGSCLFRAVAEQLFFTQVYHSDVRRSTVEYILKNPELFQSMVDEPIDIHAERMRSLKEYGGRVEMEAISIMYRHDFLMYEEIGEEPQEYTQNGFSQKIVLCHSLDRHYDSVFTKDFINKAAFCQSIVYEMLYKSVFDLKEVDYAVSKMLHDKSNKQQREHLPFIDCFSIRYEMRDSYTNVRDLLEFGITPFPYKVAKSLDEEVYRNVEYDTWNEYKKGLRYGFCTWNCRELQVGVKCSVKVDENTTHIGHIQEMAPNKGPVVVYIEKLGEMMTVPYKSLEMLPPSPIVLPPARPSPSLNLKYASLLSTMALRRTMLPIVEDPLLRRPTKLNFAPRHKAKDESNKNKPDKPQEARRDCQQPHCQQDSKSPNRMEYHQESMTEEEFHQASEGYARRGNVSSSDNTVVTEKTEAVSQIYMPIEGSRNHVYILNAQPVSSSTVSIPEARPTLVPVAAVPLQVNVMAQKSISLDGSDLPHSDVSTLRFCYNLGVDCLRMNYLTWNVRPMMAQAPHQGYVAIEGQPSEDVIINEVQSAEDSVMQTMTVHPPPVHVEEPRNPTMVQSRLDNSDCRKYEGLPLVQHPEVSSTTPSTPTTPLSPGPYYYSVDYDVPTPLCTVQAPYMEYVYEFGPPTYTFPPYPYHVPVSQDGVIYHPMVTPPPAHMQAPHVPPPHPQI